MAKSNNMDIGCGCKSYKKLGSWLSTLSNVIFLRKDTGEESENNDKMDRNPDEQSENVSLLNGLHIFSVVGLCILLCSPIILIPQHDAIQQHQYWYELFMTFCLTWPIHWTLLTILGSQSFLKINPFKAPIAFLILTLVPILGFIVIYCGLYLIWTFYLGYNFPLPFAYFISDLMVSVFIVNLWFQFPKDSKTSKKHRNRLTFFVLYIIWMNLTNYFYNPLIMMLMKMPSKVKPVMAIVLPMIRSLDAKVLQRLLNKSSSSENHQVDSYTNIISNATFNLFVTMSISTHSTLETTFCILLVGVILNLYECYKIIKLHKKIEADAALIIRKEEEKEMKIRALAISEMMEILVPLMYTLTFIVAYHGPNATILTGVTSDYWNQTPTDNIGKVLTAELILFSVDFAALIAIVIFLWHFSKINLLKEFCMVLQEYWILVATFVGMLLTKVS